ncbi:DUF4178 domain-containing protein [Desulfobacterales bacterium HSG2]|nr:DUF4178 domain-containing protein [Desulfobacterales bacterium HSG2]
MGLNIFFGKKTVKPPDPLKDLILSNLRVGWLVDFDMKTWRTEAYHYYDWGSGDISFEWQLKSHDETIYLEKTSDDEDDWSISRKIPISRVGSGIIQHITEYENPPDQIVFEGTAFYLDETGGGYFYENGNGPGQELLKWDYADDSGNRYLSIEQWGEEDFEASTGIAVQEYQFTNILPSEDASK